MRYPRVEVFETQILACPMFGINNECILKPVDQPVIGPNTQEELVCLWPQAINVWLNTLSMPMADVEANGGCSLQEN